LHHYTSVQQRTSWTMAGFTLDSINPAFLNVEHAVRGELVIKAQEYRVRLAAGASDLPFTKIIFIAGAIVRDPGADLLRKMSDGWSFKCKGSNSTFEMDTFQPSSPTLSFEEVRAGHRLSDV
jgi:hypothetical protein